MDSAGKGQHTKQSQFEIMVDFMTIHPNLAKGYVKCPVGKQTVKNLWVRLGEQLNADGPPTRDIPSWKKVWSDYKTHLKAKSRRNKINMSGTGGGPAKYLSFNSVELKALDLLGMEKAVSGMDSNRFGADSAGSESDVENAMPNSNNNSQIFEEQTNDEPPSCSQRSSNSGTARSRTGKSNLLKMQVEGQALFHKDSVRVLSYINHNLRQISRASNKSAELMEEKLELERQKLKFAKEKHEYKIKSEKARNKIRIAKIEIKKQILEKS